MNALVFIKGVVDAEQKLKVDAQGDLVDADGFVLNPYDKYALEAGLQLAEKTDGKVTVASFGDAAAEKALREALALGANDAVQITTSLAVPENGTGVVLAAATQQISDYDVILTGDQSSDDNQGYTGALLAHELSLPYIDEVNQLAVNDDQKLAYVALLDQGTVTDTLATPVVISVTDTINKPRLPSFRNKMAAKRFTLKQVAVAQDPNNGLATLAGQVTATKLAPIKVQAKEAVVFTLTADDAVDQLLEQIKQVGISL
ncbi:electron transfer flavoprotein subunit beta/FixA family protein [Loigolactobacillus coryniformis]|jgi:electron transfer flavoprotein beta subunit|uniref:electron transfer flavoprotein subunit beta/FixA family protein n=1 Tax=Loigolactobacillus coryniformis TaxID=1610 RepID=UPI002341421A|nr:electron transfer flavoprotein subunit beta/FixA family protein [Loigolactobacillus coryniformis]MDC4185438.1 electron transfer flavoprotein subunit beta/FixA family protein [Loigolactobacillus coryniformis]MDT3394354.1 electron transfer flavoprotein subunit beta/FixA family protein [Bacillota bacterium]